MTFQGCPEELLSTPVCRVDRQRIKIKISTSSNVPSGTTKQIFDPREFSGVPSIVLIVFTCFPKGWLVHKWLIDPGRHEKTHVGRPHFPSVSLARQGFISINLHVYEDLELLLRSLNAAVDVCAVKEWEWSGR